ncbi:hypothetical protein SPHINGOR109_20045 [Sphingorhabdus sp. 109]|nr:hypothetical protein SPHINGOR109_20045 [Sphingorhabdus sp. 109]
MSGRLRLPPPYFYRHNHSPCLTAQCNSTRRSSQDSPGLLPASAPNRISQFRKLVLCETIIAAFAESGVSCITEVMVNGLTTRAEATAVARPVCGPDAGSVAKASEARAGNMISIMIARIESESNSEERNNREKSAFTFHIIEPPTCITHLTYWFARGSPTDACPMMERIECLPAPSGTIGAILTRISHQCRGNCGA